MNGPSISACAAWLGASLVPIAALAAQVQFDRGGRETLPAELTGLAQIRLIDVDGDRDLDLCGAGVDGASGQVVLVVARNDGRGNFPVAERTALTASGSLTVTGLAAGDVDGDGDLDLVVGRSLMVAAGGRTLLLLNDGAGRFAASATLPDDDELGSNGIAAFDADGDRDVDLFLCGSNSIFGQTVERLLLGDGRGNFTLATPPLPQDGVTTRSPIAADVDRDGDLELCMIRGTRAFPFDGGVSLWLNDGAGGFTDATAARLPQNFGIGGLAPVLFDADGDLDLDLAVASPGDDGLSSSDRLVLNDGAGRFPLIPINYFPEPARRGTTALLPFDLDGDGDLDLFVARVDETAPISRLAAPAAVWENDGRARFTDATASRLPAVAAAAISTALGDTDGDGDDDVLIASVQRVQYFRNEAGSFTDDSRHAVPAQLLDCAEFAVGDVDGDGDQDLLATRSADNTLHFAANDGDGNFAYRTRTAVGALRFVAGDLDGDRDLDVVFRVTGQDRLWLGDGLGAFTDVTAARLPVENGRTIAILPFDRDGDGDLDLLCTDEDASTFTLTHTLLVNDGAARFAAVSGALPSFDAVPEVAVDVDRDGDLDLLAASPRLFMGIFAPRLLTNHAGVFTTVDAARFPAVPESIRRFAAGDVDGDGDVDLVLGAAMPPAPGYGQNHLFLNQGGASFVDVTATQLPAIRTDTFGLALADVDEDGDLDLCDSSTSGVTAPFELQLNDGHGRFASTGATRVARPASLYGELRVVDVDGDLDLDVVGRGPLVTFDRHRQLEAPYAPRLGGSFTLRALVEPGYGPSSAAVWIWYATARATPPIELPPFGVVRLDVSTIVYERMLVTSGGVLGHTLSVPSDPALLGATLEMQAAHVHAFGPRIGNALAERVGR